MTDPDDAYLAREARARREIDKQLAAAGWTIQGKDEIDVNADPGVATREFPLEKPHGRVDYLLFVDGQPVGVIEAKPEGTTLVEVEHQSGKYVEGLPDWMEPPSIRSRSSTSPRAPRHASRMATTRTPVAAACSLSIGPRHSPSGCGRSARTRMRRLFVRGCSRMPELDDDEAVGGSGDGDRATWRSRCARIARAR